MKKKYLFISAIIAACLAFYFWPRQKGYIEINTSGTSATLRLHHGPFSRTTVSSDKRPSAVRVDLYHPQLLQLRGRQDGDTWQIDSSGPWGKLGDIKVNKDETTVLKLGPPLLIKPNVTNRNSQVSIDFSIIGQADEHYGNVITKNGRRVSTPEVKIIDEGGKVLAAGRFQYG